MNKCEHGLTNFSESFNVVALKLTELCLKHDIVELNTYLRSSILFLKKHNINFMNFIFTEYMKILLLIPIYYNS